MIVDVCETVFHVGIAPCEHFIGKKGRLDVEVVSNLLDDAFSICLLYGGHNPFPEFRANVTDKNKNKYTR